MTKQEAIRSFELSGYKYLGFRNTGWGQKFYRFLAPYSPTNGGNSTVDYDLKLLRKRADRLQIERWFAEQKAKLEFGIQEELFGEYEYLTE